MSLAPENEAVGAEPVFFHELTRSVQIDAETQSYSTCDFQLGNPKSTEAVQLRSIDLAGQAYGQSPELRARSGCTDRRSRAPACLANPGQAVLGAPARGS